MMPQNFLHEHGLDLKKDVTIHYLGSQESSIMGTFYKSCAASGTWPPPWLALSKERQEVKNELRVLWQTKPLPNYGLVFKKGFDPEVLKVVKEVFLNLHKEKEGRTILQEMKLSKFEEANDNTYSPVKTYISNFTKNVRNP